MYTDLILHCPITTHALLYNYTLAKALTQSDIGKMFLCCCHFIHFREITQIFLPATALESCSAPSSCLWKDLHQWNKVEILPTSRSISTATSCTALHPFCFVVWIMSKFPCLKWDFLFSLFSLAFFFPNKTNKTEKRSIQLLPLRTLAQNYFFNCLMLSYKIHKSTN